MFFFLSNSLTAIIWAPMPIGKHYQTSHLVIGNGLCIWSQFRLHFGKKKRLLQGPTVANRLYLFLSSIPHLKFGKLSHGLSRIKDFFKDGHFISFKSINLHFNNPKTHLFRYLLILNYIKANYIFSLLPKMPPGI